MNATILIPLIVNSVVLVWAGVLVWQLLKDKERRLEQATLLLRAYHMMTIWKDCGRFPSSEDEAPNLEPYEWLAETTRHLFDENGNLRNP